MSATQIVLSFLEPALPYSVATAVGGTLYLPVRNVIKSRSVRHVIHVAVLCWTCRRTDLPLDRFHQLIDDLARRDFDLGDPP
jgi:hypothetical protein